MKKNHSHKVKSNKRGLFIYAVLFLAALVFILPSYSAMAYAKDHKVRPNIPKQPAVPQPQTAESQTKQSSSEGKATQGKATQGKATRVYGVDGESTDKYHEDWIELEGDGVKKN